MNTNYPTEQANAAINEGTRDMIDVYAEIHRLSKQCEVALKALKEAGVPEAVKMYEDGIVRYGLKLKWKKGSMRPDYSGCSAVTSEEKVLKDLKDLWKERAIVEGKKGPGDKPAEYTDETTGEVIAVPIIKYDADTVVATESDEF